MAQLLVVVPKELGKSQGYRQESGTLGLRIKSVRVGTANDARKFGERLYGADRILYPGVRRGRKGERCED